MNKHNFGKIGFAIACLGLTQCAGEKQQNYGAVLESLANEVVVTHYSELSSATQELADASAEFCLAPSETTLQGARDAHS